MAGAMARYVRKRIAAGKRILQGEFASCGATEQDFQDEEEFAAAVVRYARAVRDQAADENLKILAQAMVGLARRHTLWADEFLKYADIIVSLSRDELLVIGTLMIEDEKIESAGNSAITPGQAWATTLKNLLAVFPSPEYVGAVAARAQRSGLLFSPRATFGTTSYQLSPIGREVRAFVDINAALAAKNETIA